MHSTGSEKDLRKKRGSGVLTQALDELKDVKQSKSAKFTSPSGKEINISEFTISSDVKSYDDDLNEQELKIHYKNGTVEEIANKINSSTVNLTADDKYVVILDLKSFIEYLGATFKRK